MKKFQDVFKFYEAFAKVNKSHSICVDSRFFCPGDIFVAVKGHKQDGHVFLEEVCKKQAGGVVVEKTDSIPLDYEGMILETKNTQKTLAELVNIFFSYPSQKLFCVGITGTNGKTTTSYMIEEILNQNQVAVGLMGTIEHRIKDQTWRTDLTTPDTLNLHKRLNDFLKHKGRAAVLEVSSHALLQKRVEGVHFDVAVFTNLTQDHLDYHETMKAYWEAKKLLFTDFLKQSNKKKKYAIINKSDAVGREFLKELEAEKDFCVWSYGEKCEKNSSADFIYEITHQDFEKSIFLLQTPQGEVEVRLPLMGKFNVQNAVAALAVGLAAGVSLQKGVKALEKFQGVSGRMQAISNERGLGVFVDYAHTPDALNKTLEGLKNLRDFLGVKRRIVTVFGCGGNRDKTKRPLMAQVAEKNSEQVVLTSDNPRKEGARQIIEDIKKGFSKKYLKDCVVSYEDRREGISHAIKNSQPEDIILIAGKGHETKQIVGEKTLEFSDFQVAKEILRSD